MASFFCKEAAVYHGVTKGKEKRVESLIERKSGDFYFRGLPEDIDRWGKNFNEIGNTKVN